MQIGVLSAGYARLVRRGLPMISSAGNTAVQMGNLAHNQMLIALEEAQSCSNRA